jgi:hypothetical protein
MAADQEHVGQRIAAGIFEVDHDDVGIVHFDRRNQAVRAGNREMI